MALGRKTGGRKKGTPNKVQSPIKEAAREYTQEALEILAGVMRDEAQPASARVSASNSILDRAFGKPGQAIDGDDEGAPSLTITAVRRTVIDPERMTDAEVEEELKRRLGPKSKR